MARFAFAVQTRALCRQLTSQIIGVIIQLEKLEFDEEKENLMRCQDGLVILLRIENS
jgi:hypothetical protein